MYLHCFILLIKNNNNNLYYFLINNKQYLVLGVISYENCYIFSYLLQVFAPLLLRVEIKSKVLDMTSQEGLPIEWQV